MKTLAHDESGLYGARLRKMISRQLKHMFGGRQEPQGVTRILQVVGDVERHGFRPGHAKSIARGLWESAVTAAPTAIDTEIAHSVIIEAVKTGAALGGKHAANVAGQTVGQVLESSLMIGGKRVPVLGAFITAAQSIWRSRKLYHDGDRAEAALELGVGACETIGSALPGGPIMGDVMRQAAVEFGDFAFHHRAENSNSMNLIKAAVHYWHTHHHGHGGRRPAFSPNAGFMPMPVYALL